MYFLAFEIIPAMRGSENKINLKVIFTLTSRNLWFISVF